MFKFITIPKLTARLNQLSRMFQKPKKKCDVAINNPAILTDSALRFLDSCKDQDTVILFQRTTSQLANYLEINGVGECGDLTHVINRFYGIPKITNEYLCRELELNDHIVQFTYACLIGKESYGETTMYAASVAILDKQALSLVNAVCAAKLIGIDALSFDIDDMRDADVESDTTGDSVLTIETNDPAEIGVTMETFVSNYLA